MPRFVGRTIGRAVDGKDHCETPVKMQYQQVMRLEDTILIACELDKSDRGGPRRMAKRWYRWYVDAMQVIGSARATRAMKQSASHALKAGRTC